MCPWDRILFLDEVSFQYATTLKKTYALKGIRPIVPNPGGRKRQQVIGALDPKGNRLYYQCAQSLKAPEFITFLSGVVANYRTMQKIYVVLDNASVHHAEMGEQHFAAHHPNLHFVFLPPYSPDINPIEQFWANTRRSVTDNTHYSTFLNFTLHFVPILAVLPSMLPLCFLPALVLLISANCLISFQN